MTSPAFSAKFNRRTLIKGAAALGAFQVASPFIIRRVRDADPNGHGRPSPASTRPPATR